MNVDEAIEYSVRYVGGCECNESLIPSSAKEAEFLAVEAIAEDYNGRHRRAIKFYKKCIIYMRHAMENDIKCDILMDNFRFMSNEYKERIKILRSYMEKKREMKRRIEEVKRRQEKLRELQYCK